MNATTTAPTESMFIDMSRILFKVGSFEDIAETLQYYEDKEKDLIHAAIGRCFYAYMRNPEKMSVNFWDKQVDDAYVKAIDIVADACYAPAEQQDDKSDFVRQFIIKLDQLTEFLNR